MGYYRVTKKSADKIILDHNLQSDGSPMERITIDRPPSWLGSDLVEGSVVTMNGPQFNKQFDTVEASQSRFPDNDKSSNNG